MTMRPSRDWYWRRHGDRPLIYGHRGARAHETENTIASFSRAIADGADGIELDVRLTRDGQVLVLHDLDFKRVTDGSDVRTALDVDATTATSIVLRGGQRAPLLADVFAWAEANDARINVELKHDDLQMRALVWSVARLLHGRPKLEARVMVSSFEPRQLALARLAMPATPRAFLFHQGQRLATTAAPRLISTCVDGDALHPERTLCSPSLVARWRATGKLLNVWTVNEANEARDLAKLGVDGLIGDDPGLLRAAFAPSTR